MTVQVQILGRNGRVVEASANGELVTAAIAYSDGTFNSMDEPDTAYNFHKPTAGKRFVVTGFIISANRNVGVNGAVIEFYEATAADTTTASETKLRLDMARSAFTAFSTNFLLNEGVFFNGKTDDDDVLATVAGYEVDA